MNLELLESFGQNYPEEFDGVLDCISVAVTGNFNRHGTLLCVGCNDGRLVIWDFLTRGISKVISAHVHPVCSVCWSRNGRKILTASTDNSVCVIDVSTGDCENKYQFPSPVLKVQYNPRDMNSFLVCPLRHAALYGLLDGTTTPVPLDDEDDLNIVATFDRRGKMIFTGNSRGKVCGYQLPKMELKVSFRIGGQSSTAVKSIDFSRRGGCFVVNSGDRILRVYDCKTVEETGVDGDPEPIQKLQDLVNKTMWKKCCFSGDGEYICAGSSRQHAIYIWERSVGNLVKILHGTKGEILLDVMWHPVRPIIASISSGVVSIWSQNQVENWSAFAPDFKELDENVEYEERESEFDAEDEDKITMLAGDGARDELEVDVVGVAAIDAFCSSDEDCEDPNALLFLPFAPDVEEVEEGHSAPGAADPYGAQKELHKRSFSDHHRERDRDRDYHKENSSPRRKKAQRVYDISLNDPPTDEVHPMLSNKPHKDKISGSGKKSSSMHRSSKEHRKKDKYK